MRQASLQSTILVAAETIASRSLSILLGRRTEIEVTLKYQPQHLAALGLDKTLNLYHG
jgi:hypothetical protein